MLRSLLARSLLAFALLFAQTGGLAHGISHILADQSQDSDQSLPHDKYCDQCEAYAQISGAVGSSAISFVTAENFVTPHPVNSGFLTSSAFAAFAARAPPYSS